VEIEAKSYILSVERYDRGGSPDEWLDIPDFEEKDLQEIGERIRAGEPYPFQAQGVRAVVDQMEAARAFNPSWWALILYLLRMFLPIIIFLAVLFALPPLVRYLGYLAGK
jgi:hypothetical protein